MTGEGKKGKRDGEGRRGTGEGPRLRSPYYPLNRRLGGTEGEGDAREKQAKGQTTASKGGILRRRFMPVPQNEKRIGMGGWEN